MTCQKCAGYYCFACYESFKGKEEHLREKLIQLDGFHCLCCVILKSGVIHREHLNLLQNKQLVEYCNEKHISTASCREKYDLIDLIIEHAKTHHLLNQRDVARENVHDNHLRTLQQAANNLREQEATSQRNQADFSDHATTTTNDSPPPSSAYIQQQQQQHERQQQQYERQQQQHERQQQQHERQQQQHERQQQQHEQQQQQHEQQQQQQHERQQQDQQPHDQNQQEVIKFINKASIKRKKIISNIYIISNHLPHVSLYLNVISKIQAKNFSLSFSFL